MSAYERVNHVESEIDREHLAGLIAEAAEKCFPRRERVGGSPQRDFYFRRLLGQLIENTRLFGVPFIGGTFEALHAFVARFQRDWERHPAYKAGRSSYGLNAMAALTSHWKHSLDRERKYEDRWGKFEFVFDKRGRGAESEIVFGVAVSDFVTSNGSRCDIRCPAHLPASVQLPSGPAADDDNESAKTAIVDKHVRQVWKRGLLADVYRQKLLTRSFIEIKQHVAEFNRYIRARDARKAVACVIVIFISALYYSILPTPFEPRVVVHAGNFVTVRNVRVNDWGEVALLSDDGIQATDWVNRIVNKQTGAYVTAHCDSGGCRAEWRGPCSMTTDIGWKWRTNSPEPLPVDVRWIPSTCDNRRILVWVLLDVREFLPSARSERVPFTLRVGSDREKLPTVVSWLNREKTHLMLMWNYGLSRDGIYPIDLVYSPDLHRDSNRKWVRNNFVETSVAWLRVEHGKEPVAENAGACVCQMNEHAFDYARRAGIPVPQAAVVRDPKDGKVRSLAIVPDLKQWPPFGELSKALYGVRIGSTWVRREELQVRPFADGVGYYFVLPLAAEAEEFWPVELIGNYGGRDLPASSPIPLLLHADGSATFADDERYPVLVSENGSALWDRSSWDLPGTRRPAEKRPAECGG